MSEHNLTKEEALALAMRGAGIASTEQPWSQPVDDKIVWVPECPHPWFPLV